MNRAVMARRAASNPTITGRFGEIVPPVLWVAPGAIRARRAARLTATQRDSQGRLSDWSRSPYAPKGGWR